MYKITSYFQDKESFRQIAHRGIDFSMENGTELRSIRDGIVSKVVDYGNQNAGKAVMVKWEDGKTAIYGHLSKFNVVEGQSVSAGDIIGFSGNSGHVVGANGGYHLHFGLKENNQFIDPSPYIKDIQHMNDPGYLVQNVQNVVETKTSMLSIMSQYSDLLNEIAKSFKLHLVDVFLSVDYTQFIKLFQYVIQLIFFYS
ncbi:M23 family metallopeptidase [Niallia taxi]|uniref:M23 family metallopeptidase n=1 Tax=Niallia taxi TaxID=2499688 RepID=UPI00317D68E7